MGKRLNRPGIDRLLRFCDILDTRSEYWQVCGDSFRAGLLGARVDLDDTDELVRGLQGRGGKTRRGGQQTLKARLWADHGRRFCERCGRALTWATMHPHHRVRVADGGCDELGNIAVLCSLCHDEEHGSA